MPEVSYAWRNATDRLSENARAICRLLEEHEELHVDAMGDKLGCSAPEILAELFDLEMNDLVLQKPGKYFRLCTAA